MSPAVSSLSIDLSPVCFRSMWKGTCILQVRVPLTVLFLPSCLPTSFSPFKPQCPNYQEKWWKNDCRKLLWVIFLEANPNTEEDLDSVTKLQGSLWRRKVFFNLFLKKEGLGYDFYFPMRKVDGGWRWGQTASNRNIPGGNWAFPVKHKVFMSYLLGHPIPLDWQDPETQMHPHLPVHAVTLQITNL